MVEKINLESGNILEENISKLRQIFPNVFSEGKIDFDKLKENLGVFKNTSEDKYTFSWAGRMDSIKNIQTPTHGTLIPQKDESINFDETENIFIEGENLEVLKLLQKTYSNKIKMIYIDPPYNTGNDFIYKDDFKDSLDNYLQQTGQKKEGIKLTSNPETSGRFHSDWISFMYPRLFLARELLKDDGVIFVSIDDNEINNLRNIMNEIFGEENFLTQFVWNTEGSTDNQLEVKIVHEYILMYVKDIKNKSIAIGHVIAPDTKSDSKVFKEFIENTAVKNSKGNPPKEITLPAGFPCEIDSLKLTSTKIKNSFFDEVSSLKFISRELTKKYNVEYPIRKDSMTVSSGKLDKTCTLFSGWANSDKFESFVNNKLKPVQEDDGEFSFYLSKKGVLMYKKRREKTRHILSVIRNVGTTNQARSDLEKLELTYEYPKPKELLKYLVKMGSKQNDIVLDFFAGSGTMAEVIFDLDNEGEPRKIILAQLPEKIIGSSLKFSTISDLCKSRIQKISKKYTFSKDYDSSKDYGFKVFKLAKSNYKVWQDVSDEAKLKEQLKLFEDPLVENYKDIDVIYEIIIKEGYSLNSEIKEVSGTSNKIYKVTDDEFFFFVTLDKTLDEKSLDSLNLDKNTMFVCLDSAINDSQKTNLDKLCKLRTI